MDSRFAAEASELGIESFDEDESSMAGAGSSRLIEFPGVSRRSVPEWRKELSARVREVQERKAREAAAEAEEAARLGIEAPQPIIPQLNLLPRAELPDLNPVVAAALRRIERAHRPTITSYSRAATAVAVAQEKQAEIEFSPEPLAVSELEAPMPSEPAPIPERTHNLVVVQAPVANEVEEVTEKPKPKRLIVEDDPVLSYLDNIEPAFGPANLEDHAPIFRRILAAFADVIVVGFLSLPVAAVIELQDGNWHQVKIIGLMAGIATVLMFVYSTISTALTGRTFGMRLFSLRAVDVRTGLIPTGNQSAGRALFYLFTMATAGLGLLMVFARGEGKTVHDRMTHTAVIRD
ncbi:MAG TPA: RDD family protein [Pyrinomonadaceae bacterium]|jgi:uncharacterized RDD family membrane protein YckC|nr:RDD family protein [Pyrinomonadaceae bacterium]